MTFNEKFMKKVLKRVHELKRESIEKFKKVPNSETIVKTQLEVFYRIYGECRVLR